MKGRKKMSQRYVGGYPAIGIRPTIDGRRGVLKVRESLEDQTMNMAKAAAELISSNLRYSNGEPVKVVIADTTIGRVAEAAACRVTLQLIRVISSPVLLFGGIFCLFSQ